MTRTSLRSAVMEVGLFYQKGWSADRIARFTFRLHRRRLRAQEAIGRAQRTASPFDRVAAVAYQIEPQRDPWVAYEVTPLKVEAWTAYDPSESRHR